MSLSRQIFLYAVGTDAFYNEQETLQHKRLLLLYGLRKKIQQGKVLNQQWRLPSINRVIGKEKEKLTHLLDERLQDNSPRSLKTECLKPKNVITLFESSLTRALGLKQNELTESLFVLNVFFFQVFESLVKNGFIHNGEKYIFLTASAGQIRTKRAVFVKESEYLEVQKKLMCGLTVEHINEMGGTNPNKFLAYLALNGSATDVWEGFDIDKSIVVDDFETDVFGMVDYINGTTYEITRKEMPCNIPHMDGCGIMLDKPTRMVRMPWVKGLLVYFPFDEFIKEKCPNGTAVVTDIYGTEHDIFAEEIKYVFTKSQFKMAQFYNSWEEYKEYFKRYGCEACYCNIEEEVIPQARINYQMLQTLSDMTDEEIGRLTKRSEGEIDNIGKDYQTTLRLLGATEYNQNPSAFQQALMIYPELFRDPYSKEVLKQTKKSLVKQAKAGRLRVNGKYFFLSPDLYAFCEWLFLGDQNPQGLLQDGEVYCNEFGGEDELACLRSPHLYREWPIRTNKRNEELDKWFGKTKCVYTSCHDLITKYVMADCDGDKLLVIKDSFLTRVAKRNMSGIVPLYYEMKKAKGEMINSASLYQGMARAFTGGNIGPISNNISKVWNSGQIGEEQLSVVKWLCFQNNAIIDFAKTLWLPTPPKEIEKIIKSYTKAKVPHFFIYAKDKTVDKVEKTNGSTMNRLSDSVGNSKMQFSKNVGKLDYRMLMNLRYGFDIRENNPIIRCYDYYNKRQKYLFATEDESTHAQDELYMYQYIRNKILEETGADLEYVANTLVAYYYTIRQGSTKKMLWACFGDVILENLKKNTVGLGKICPMCGKRFQPNSNNQNCCDWECSAELHRRKSREKVSSRNNEKTLNL